MNDVALLRLWTAPPVTVSNAISVGFPTGTRVVYWDVGCRVYAAKVSAADCGRHSPRRLAEAHMRKLGYRVCPK